MGFNNGVVAKLARWYWCGAYGELYGGAIESRFAKDLPEVLAWVESGPEPSSIADANFAPTRLLTLRNRNSAAYKGLHALLMRECSLDFRTGYAIDQVVHRTDLHGESFLWSYRRAARATRRTLPPRIF